MWPPVHEARLIRLKLMEQNVSEKRAASAPRGLFGTLWPSQYQWDDDDDDEEDGILASGRL